MHVEKRRLRFNFPKVARVTESIRGLHMEITSQRIGDIVEVKAKGRLDGYWADHLSKALEDIMRQGNHRIRVNMSEVSYMSSMGIRVLVQFYKKLSAIQGSFAVSEPSDSVKKVLEMVGMGMLMPAAPTVAELAAKPETLFQSLESPNAGFEIYDLGAGASPAMKCRMLGDPSLLDRCRFGEADCRGVSFPRNSLALGLGAFGNNFSECSGRFGEFLAVAGASAYQPTDGSNVPDLLLAQGTFIPDLQVLYGAAGDGAFAKLARFEAKPDSRAVGLTEIAESALRISGADRAWVVLIAESGGLVGANLRKPPIGGSAGPAPFAHPEVRKWLSFTTERAYSNALVVAVGIVSRAALGALKTFLRPLSREEGPAGHFHAAAFSYGPLQRGLIDLDTTVHSLFQNENLLGLLHLIGDDRGHTGVAESEFVRGACWIGAIPEVEPQRS